MAIRVILVDNPASRLENLRDIVDTEQDMEVIAEAADGLSAVHLAAEMKPEVVVMGVLIPGMNSFEATRRILTKHQQARVVILGNYADKFIIDQALDAGASRYLLRNQIQQELPDAIRKSLTPD